MHAFRQRQQVLTPPERVVLRWTLNSSAGRPVGSTSTTWASTSSTAREGSGPTLLLIHGYPFNSWDWAPLWDRLTDRFTVIAPDMLGMGFSDKPVAYEYSVHDHADMHEALLSDLGLGSAHILAHDIGDSVGQELLARHEFGQQVYGALRIESITWLNGGLFNEAYTPRLLQKVMSRTPLGDILSPLQGSAFVAATDRAHHQRDVRSRHQTVPPDARPVPPDPRVQRRQAGDCTRSAGSSTTATRTAIGGYGRCGRPTSRCG